MLQPLRTLVRLQILVTASMKLTVFCDVAPCSLVEVRRRFRGRSPWWWRQQVPLNRRCTSIRLHGETFQKTSHLQCYLVRNTFFAQSVYNYCIIESLSVRLHTLLVCLSVCISPIYVLLYMRLKSVYFLKSGSSQKQNKIQISSRSTVSIWKILLKTKENNLYLGSVSCWC
jgi:hypothetical protein